MLTDMRFKVRFVCKAVRAVWTLVGQLIAMNLQMNFQLEALRKATRTLRALQYTLARVCAISGAQWTFECIFIDVRASMLLEIAVFQETLRTVRALVRKFASMSVHVRGVNRFMGKTARTIDALVGQFICVDLQVYCEFVASFEVPWTVRALMGSLGQSVIPACKQTLY